jgi:hypothetical protein
MSAVLPLKLFLGMTEWFRAFWWFLMFLFLWFDKPRPAFVADLPPPLPPSVVSMVEAFDDTDPDTELLIVFTVTQILWSTPGFVAVGGSDVDTTRCNCKHYGRAVALVSGTVQTSDVVSDHYLIANAKNNSDTLVFDLSRCGYRWTAFL